MYNDLNTIIVNYYIIITITLTVITQYYILIKANRLFMRTIKVKFETLIIIRINTNYYLNSIIFMFLTDHFISIL